MEARKVPNIANVTIAPKLEKKGFCKEQKRKVKRPISNERMQQEWKDSELTGERLKPDWVKRERKVKETNCDEMKEKQTERKNASG